MNCSGLDSAACAADNTTNTNIHHSASEEEIEHNVREMIRHLSQYSILAVGLGSTADGERLRQELRPLRRRLHELARINKQSLVPQLHRQVHTFNNNRTIPSATAADDVHNVLIKKAVERCFVSFCMTLERFYFELKRSARLYINFPINEERPSSVLTAATATEQNFFIRTGLLENHATCNVRITGTSLNTAIESTDPGAATVGWSNLDIDELRADIDATQKLIEDIQDQVTSSNPWTATLDCDLERKRRWHIMQWSLESFDSDSLPESEEKETESVEKSTSLCVAGNNLGSVIKRRRRKRCLCLIFVVVSSVILFAVVLCVCVFMLT